MVPVRSSLEEGGDDQGLLLDGDLGSTDRGKGGTAKEGNPHSFGLNILIDEKGEGTPATEDSEQLPCGSRRSSFDDFGTEVSAKAGEMIVEALGAHAANNGCEFDTAGVKNWGEQLPVAAVSGEEKDRSIRRTSRFDDVETLHPEEALRFFGRPPPQVETLGEAGAEVEEAASP
jgi:hypothetical protein